jgi:dCTP deaminase
MVPREIITDQRKPGNLMILVDWQLRDRIARGHIKIDPYDPKLVQPNSVDIRRGNHFVWYNPGEQVIDPYDKASVTSDVGETHAEFFVLAPGQFVLAETLECIGLPDNIVATIEGKSSIARLGVTLHQTGGWIDTGFRGTITLEMANINARPVKVYAGMPIGQLVFYTTERAENPYDKKTDAKYLDQRQATLSRYPENKK